MCMFVRIPTDVSFDVFAGETNEKYTNLPGYTEVMNVLKEIRGDDIYSDDFLSLAFAGLEKLARFAYMANSE